MIKIVHIVTDTNIGGAGYHLLSILENYDRTRFIIEVIVPQDSRLLPLIGKLAIMHEVDHIAEKSFSFKGIFAIRRVLREIKPDIVHTHSSFSGRVAGSFYGAKVLYSRHYCVTSTKWGFLNNLFCTKVIATSDEVERGLVASGVKPARIVKIRNGVAPVQELLEEEKAAIHKKYKIPENAFVVSQIGRLVELKGHRHTIEAARLLLKDQPDVVIVIVGDGPMENELRSIKRSERLTNVIFTGYTSSVNEILNITHLQLNASSTENASLALLEGLSLGIPAVATNVGGNPYIVTDNERGLLVPFGDGHAIYEAIVKIKNDFDLYATLRKNAKDGYEKNFRVETMLEQLEALYTKMEER